MRAVTETDSAEPVATLRCEVRDRAAALAAGRMRPRELVLMAGACLEMARAQDVDTAGPLSVAIDATLAALPLVSGR